MPQESPISFRIESELSQRLEECAQRTRIKKYQLALLALEAAVEAIEKNDYKLVVPIQFSVEHVAVPAKEAIRYPPHRPRSAIAGDETTPALNTGERNEPSSGKGSKDMLRKYSKQILARHKKPAASDPSQSK